MAEQARAEAIVGFYGDRSIAVLPFTNISSDPEQGYFVDGIAEEVLNELAVANTEAAQRLVLNPPFAVLYNDSRWNAWLDSIDMSAERLDAIEFDPNLPE